MVRVAMIILGALLLASGLVSNGGEGLGWMRVLDVGFALVALLIGLRLQASHPEVFRFGAPLAIAAGLFGLSLFALAAGAPLWQYGTNFGIACAFALLAYSEKLSTRYDEPAVVIPFRRRAS